MKRFSEGGRCDGFVRDAVPRWQVGGEGGIERFGGRDGAAAVGDVVAEVGGAVVDDEGGEAVEVSMWCRGGVGRGSRGCRWSDAVAEGRDIEVFGEGDVTGVFDGARITIISRAVEVE